jgi:Zn-dependent alcohol dehydrogenase
MKAAVLHAPRQPMTIEDVVIEKPRRREVLVRTAAAGLCHSDLHFIEGAYPTPVPVVLGHESAGIVEAVGEDVTYVKPGDHVISCLSVFCGHCEFCLSGHLSICQTPEVKMPPGVARRLSWRGEHLNQFLNLSSFAEQMVVHEHALVKVRDDMPLDLASLIGCSVITGYGAVAHTARIEPGSTVAVFGAGGIGLATINAAQIAGASRIIAVDKDPFKLGLAKDFGATDVVDASEGDTVKRIVALTSGGVPLFVRVHRPQGDRRAELLGAALGRHGDADRHDPGRNEDRAARRRLPARAPDPGLHDGIEPLPHRHAAPDRVLPARSPAPAGRWSRHGSSSSRSTKASPRSRPAGSPAT